MIQNFDGGIWLRYKQVDEKVLQYRSKINNVFLLSLNDDIYKTRWRDCRHGQFDVLNDVKNVVENVCKMTFSQGKKI